MTICIAARCANSHAIVAASDRMLSAHFLALEFDHPDSKIENLAPTCIGISAGDALATGELFGASSDITQQLLDPQIHQIVDKIKEKFVELRSKEIEENIFKPRGITLVDFYQRGLITSLPNDLAMMLDVVFQ